MSKRNIDFLAIAALCTAMLIWGSSFIAFKSAVQDMGPSSIIFFRMLVASLCFVYFIPSFFRLSFNREDIKYIMLMVLFEPCLYFLFESHALTYTSAGQAGMITAMMPLITAIGASIFLKEYISKKMILGSLIAISGAIWLSLSSDASQNASNPILGNSLELGAMICAAGYTIAVRHLIQKFSVLFLTAIQSFAGFIFFLPFAAWETNTIPFHFSVTSMSWVVYMGVVVTLGGYGLYNFGLSRMQANKAAIYINLIPIFSVLLAFLILGEKLTAVSMLASAVILTGVIITQIPMDRLRQVFKKVFHNN